MSGGDFLVATSAALICFAILSRFGYLTGAEYRLWRIAPLVGLLFVIPLYFSDSYSLEHEDYGRAAVAILTSGASLLGILIVVMHRNEGLFVSRRLYIISLTITTVCLILWRLVLDLFAKGHVARTVVILGDTRIGKILGMRSRNAGVWATVWSALSPASSAAVSSEKALRRDRRVIFQLLSTP